MTLGVKQRFAILARDGFRCVYCGATSMAGARLEVDHVLARSKGGTDDDDNLVTACWDCNRGKQAQSVHEAAGYADDPHATCTTALAIAIKADQLGLSYRTVRRLLVDAGHIVPPNAPHQLALVVTDANRAHMADVMEQALVG